MLDHRGNEIVDTSRLSEENLTLTILNVFLNIQSDGLCDTKILHILRNVYTQLLGHVEEMVNSMS